MKKPDFPPSGLLDITRFPEPRPERGFRAAGTVNQGRAPWLTTLLPAGLSIEECCAAAQGLRSPYETASVVSVYDQLS